MDIMMLGNINRYAELSHIHYQVAAHEEYEAVQASTHSHEPDNMA